MCRVERRPGLGGRRLLRRLGLSRIEQLLRQVAAVSDHGPGGDAWPGTALWPAIPGPARWPGGKALLVTYDAHETGVVEDGIDGGAGGRRRLVQPGPSLAAAGLLECSPGSRKSLGAARENHIMRSSSVVQAVHYGKGRIAYSTYDAAAPCEDVLRLAFLPRATRFLRLGATVNCRPGGGSTAATPTHVPPKRPTVSRSSRCPTAIAW